MSIINRPPEMVKREYELQEPIAVAVDKYATFIQSTPDHVVDSALKIVVGETWSSAAGTGPRKRAELSHRGWRGTSTRKQMPSETPRWLVIPERDLFTGIVIVGAVPLKNRNRSYAGSALPEDHARRTVTKAQAQLIQSNCPSATKNLNAVAHHNSHEEFRTERN